jgi:hypothetical protein
MCIVTNNFVHMDWKYNACNQKYIKLHMTKNIFHSSKTCDQKYNTCVPKQEKWIVSLCEHCASNIGLTFALIHRLMHLR